MKGESSIITAKKTIEFLKSSFTPYNSLDLVLKLSALRLLPQNAEKTVRLDLLLHTASSLLNFRAPRITDNKMRTIINHKFVSESFFRFQEDPGTNIFCEELSFYGGGYRVFPGINSSIIYQLKNTFYALFQNNKQLLPQENLEEIEKLIMFVLSISEAIADRSGIERYVDTIYTKDIYMPSQKQLFELGLCNLFKENELNQLAEELDISQDKLSFIFSNFDQRNLDSYNIEKGNLISSPIIKYEGLNIVTDPSSLLYSLKTRILDIIYANHLEDKFNASYVESIWGNVHSSLYRLGFYQKTYVDGTKVEDHPFVFDTFQFDKDKLAFVLLVFDNFKGERSAHLEVDFDEEKARLEWVIDFIFSTADSPNDIFLIYLTSFYERSFSFNKSLVGFKSISMSADDLECLSYLEHSKNLFLYKFFIARELASKETQFISFKWLAEYGLFKHYNSSFHIINDNIPSLLEIGDNYARGSIHKMKIESDIHSVFIPFENSYTDVVLLHEKSFPLYAPVNTYSISEFLIESFSIPIWLCSDQLRNRNFEYRSLLIEIIDDIAYWIVELKPGLSAYINSNNIGDYLILKVDLDERVQWDNIRNDSLMEDDENFSIKLNFPNTVSLFLSRGMNKLLGTADNSGERVLISSLLKAIADLIRDRNNHPGISEDEITKIINNHMPLGKKKKIGIYDSSKIPELNPLDIVKPNVLDIIDTNILMKELGDYITQEKFLPGETKEENYNFIKNIVVSFLINKMTEELKIYDKEDLFNYLIGQNESLIYERILHEIQLPMRIEIGNKDMILKDFQDTYSRINQSSPACRFLIEYSLGMNIGGIKKISDYDYYRLLAISHEIIYWGFIGDLIRFEISDIKVKLLKSKLLFVESESYEEAYNVFAGQIGDYNLERYNSEFSKYWEEKETKSNSDPDNKKEEFDKLFIGEFGFSLEDLIQFERVIFDYSRKVNTTILTIETIKFKKLFSDTVPEKSLENILYQWVLVDRDDFYDVPELKLEPYEFFPWRFNRSYSLIRRPLILVEIEGTWHYKIGLRLLKVSVDNYTSLLRNNRLVNKIKSPKLKAMLTEFAANSNVGFVKKVKEIFNNQTRYACYENVKKIGKHRITDKSGNDLGDIDVLVIDNKKCEILFIECKDMLVSRTPYEMHLEIKKVFTSSNSQVEKHSKRVEWGMNNVELLITALNLQKKKNWKINGYFVSSAPLFSPLVKKIKGINYFTFDNLKKMYYSALH